jgi:RNA polymerase sigma-70 factor (ECF subfamily)
VSLLLEGGALRLRMASPPALTPVPETPDAVSSPPRSGAADHLLLARIGRGDRGAVAELYQRYAGRLARFVATRTSGLYDADDVVQSAFRTFIATSDNGHYHLPDGQDLWGLLVVIALNKLRSRGRYATARKRAADSEAVSAGATGRDADPSGVIDLRDALERLPAAERELVELRAAGHGVDEIARRVGRSKRTVERQLRACRESLDRLVTADD